MTLDCPNNRYIADEKICVAVAAMLAQINVTVKLNAMPRATYFPKIQNYDTSFYMLGWGVPTFDSQYALQSLLRTVVPKTADGDYNLGRWSNAAMDRLIEQIEVEPDPAKRNEAIRQALVLANHGRVRPHPAAFPGDPVGDAQERDGVVHRADNRVLLPGEDGMIAKLGPRLRGGDEV